MEFLSVDRAGRHGGEGQDEVTAGAGIQLNCGCGFNLCTAHQFDKFHTKQQVWDSTKWGAPTSLLPAQVGKHRPPSASRGYYLPRVHYRGNVTVMAIAQSKVTAQGQISVPAEVRKKLGVGPGSVLEWDEQGSEVVVRRAGRHSSKDIYLALFAAKTPKKNPPDVKGAIRKYIRKRHARG